MSDVLPGAVRFDAGVEPWDLEDEWDRAYFLSRYPVDTQRPAKADPDPATVNSLRWALGWGTANLVGTLALGVMVTNGTWRLVKKLASVQVFP